jgi:hypothetical protein
MKRLTLFMAAMALGLAAQGADHDRHLHDHAHLTQSPAGVIADHVHEEGIWMVS